MITKKMTIGAGMVMAALAFAPGCGNGDVSAEIESLRKEVASLKAEVRGLRKAIDHRPTFDREAHRERIEAMRRSAESHQAESRTNGAYRVHPPARPLPPGEAADRQMGAAMRDKMEMRRMEMRRKHEAERESRRRLMEERRRQKEQARRQNDGAAAPADGGSAK